MLSAVMHFYSGQPMHFYSGVDSELLTEIDLGLESVPAARQLTDIDDGPETQRFPIPEREQVAVAMHILRLRLVEPARALAEAERIAGGLVQGDGRPMHIQFVDPDGQTIDRDEGLILGSETDRTPGDRRIPDQLQALLDRIADLSRSSEA